MGEAERSIAIKRKAVIPKAIEREDSPSEVYTPKRKKSTGAEASPPPYIPSRKESSTSTRISSVQRVDHHNQPHRRIDARQILSSRDRKDLISRSRRMELFKKIGIDRKEPLGIRQHEARKIENRRDSKKEHIDTATSEESSSKKPTDVRDLKITARLGPMRSTESKKTDIVDERNKELNQGSTKSTRTSYSKDNTLQVIINPVASPALKGSLASRLGKVIVKRHDSSPDSYTKNASTISNDRKDVGKVDKDRVSRERTRLAVTRHAKSLVNKQCREAVISVKEQGRRLHRSASPDSRVVEAHVSDTETEESNLKDREEIIVETKRSLSLSPSRSEKVSVQIARFDADLGRRKADVGFEKDEREPEDLAEMIGEDLEPELLNDTVQDELNLDLEEVNDDADDIETLIGVKSEDDKPKPGTRFIVTLDGVDERQFDSEAERNKSLNPTFIQPSVENLPKLPLSSTPFLPHPKLPPLHVLPLQPSLAHMSPPVPVYAVGSPLPPLPVKPLPPKIQPFSINLKDSDDEIEDKESRLQQPSPAGYMPQTSTALQKAKMSERCKFWPACAAGSECEFHHPTSYCKTFPNCKFMDKCLFIHPNCRFDSKCTRQDCPFTHTSRRPGLSATVPLPAPAPMPISPPVTSTVCRFFPNCHNLSCPFVHPKPCRFGMACQNTGCLFYHPPAPPSKDKLKWKAPLQKETIPLKVPAPPDPAAKFRQPVAKVSPMSAGNSNVFPNIR